MKIVSEITGKNYSTVEECLKAEADFVAKQKQIEQERVKKEEARGQRAKEVEEAYKAAINVRQNCQKMISEADKKYQDLLNAFLKDYKQFHFTLQSEGPMSIPAMLFDFFNI